MIFWLEIASFPGGYILSKKEVVLNRIIFIFMLQRWKTVREIYLLNPPVHIRSPHFTGWPVLLSVGLCLEPSLIGVVAIDRWQIRSSLEKVLTCQRCIKMHIEIHRIAGDPERGWIHTGKQNITSGVDGWITPGCVKTGLIIILQIGNSTHLHVHLSNPLPLAPSTPILSGMWSKSQRNSFET